MSTKKGILTTTKHPAVGLVFLMAAFGLLLCVSPESPAAGDTAGTDAGANAVDTHAVSDEQADPAPGHEEDAAQTEQAVSGETDATQVNPTVADLARKGYPSMPTPRREALTRTAKLSTEEAVKDIGFPFRGPVIGLIFEPGSLNAWAVYLPENDVTIRLIEEGREDPDKISKLVEEMIDESLDLYPGNFPGYLESSLKLARDELDRDARSLSENDAYYNEHFRYDRPLFEHQRLEYVMPAGFYLLHNIARLTNAEQIRRWIQLERQPGKECKELEVFFIDCFFVDIGSAAGGVHGERHRTLTDGGIPVDWWVVSRWNQPWSVNDPMLGMKDVDTSGLETIDIVEIPTRLLSYSEEEARSIAILKSKGLDFDLAQSFSEEELDAIIQNFMDYCDTL